MRQRKLINLALLLSLIMAAFAAETTRKEVAVKGYVLDSAYAFTKGLKKPISAECATACAKAGSPLVILAPSGAIYRHRVPRRHHAGGRKSRRESSYSSSSCGWVLSALCGASCIVRRRHLLE